MDTRTLTARKIGHMTLVANDLLNDAHIEVDDMLANRTRIAVYGFLWAEDVGEVTIDRPANWWQHLKKWLSLPYGRLYTTISFRAYYPDYKLIPNIGRVSLLAEAEPGWGIDSPLFGLDDPLLD